MLIQEEQELLGTVAANIVLTAADNNWSYAVLDIRLIGRMVDFGLNFYDGDNLKKNLPLENAFNSGMAILKLHKLTNAHPSYAKWNIAVFTLQQNAKYKIEYKWDQALQDKVDQARKS